MRWLVIAASWKAKYRGFGTKMLPFRQCHLFSGCIKLLIGRALFASAELALLGVTTVLVLDTVLFAGEDLMRQIIDHHGTFEIGYGCVSAVFLTDKCEPFFCVHCFCLLP